MKKEETRKLTKAETRRFEIFNQEKEKLEAQGYKTTYITPSLVKANIVGSLFGLLVSIPFIILFYAFRKDNSFVITDDYFRNYLIFMLLLFVLIVVHELIHGITWSLFASKGLKSIEFGFILKTLNPYCTCNEALNRKQYIIGTIMPCLILGVIPCIISLFNHNEWFLAMGVLMIISAGGDLLICKMIYDYKTNKDTLYRDHPTDIGVVCFEKQ